MRKSQARHVAAGLTVAFAVLTPAWVWACSTPVFRYALENWAADPYEVLVFHRGPLTEPQQAAVDHLRGEVDDAAANLDVHTIDLAGETDDAVQALWQAQATEALPWMVVHYPSLTPARRMMWAGPLDAGVAEALTDSPMRTEIARRLVGGDSAVWVLLESGDKAKDDAAAKLVAEQVAQLAKTIELPEPIDDGFGAPVDAEDAPPLQLAFSTLRLARGDAAERMLVRMLLRSEPDLETFDEPLVFPVFGRGRALWAMVGAGITNENINEAATFLAGACSCEVKAQNPGTDLVMRVDWDAALPEPAFADVFPARLPAPLAADAPNDAEPDVPATVASAAGASPILRNVGLLVVVALAGLAATTVLMRRKQAGA